MSAPGSPTPLDRRAFLGRLGLGALGAALAGVAANRAGFGGGLTDQTAMATANTVFLAAIPIALLGVAAAAVMTRRAAPA